jgi:hypothetical protein
MRNLLDRIKAKPRFYKSQQRMHDGYIIPVAQCARMLTAACMKAEAHRLTHHVCGTCLQLALNWAQIFRP